MSAVWAPPVRPASVHPEWRWIGGQQPGWRREGDHLTVQTWVNPDGHTLWVYGPRQEVLHRAGPFTTAEAAMCAADGILGGSPAPERST